MLAQHFKIFSLSFCVLDCEIRIVYIYIYLIIYIQLGGILKLLHSAHRGHLYILNGLQKDSGCLPIVLTVRFLQWTLTMFIVYYEQNPHMKFELISDFKGQDNSSSAVNAFINQIIMYVQINSTGRSVYCQCFLLWCQQWNIPLLFCWSRTLALLWNPTVCNTLQRPKVEQYFKPFCSILRADTLIGLQVIILSNCVHYLNKFRVI